MEVADLKIKLAEALNGLEFFDDAIPIARETLASVQSANSSQNKDRKYRAGIALVKALTGDARGLEAKEILAPLLNECHAEQGDNSETYLELLLLKGQVAVLNGDDHLARQYFADVAKRREALWGKSDLRTLDAKFWLTDVYVEPGEPDAAIPFADDVTEQFDDYSARGIRERLKRS